ncbi:MAG: phosphoglycerate kinase [Candidatus Aenigmarchaeota archaeon]|nr:phosphoglycerate kinase [Candidatus Aenigmarchaeota archaeon]
MEKILTIDDMGFRGKRVLVRIDINSPVVDGVVQDSPRIKAHAETIKELIDLGAGVIILAHQGRPGDKDYTNMEQHAKLLSKHIGKPVKFVADVYGELAVSEIRKLKSGEALLLDNVRSVKEEMEKLKPEEFAETEYIKTLSNEADVFVNDAFSVSHRAQASVVGFVNLPAVAGRIMERELTSLEKIENPKKPMTFVLGGAKPEEKLKPMKSGRFDYVLTGGIVADLFLIARGKNLGKSNKLIESKYKDSLAAVKGLISENIKTPVDFAVDDNGRREIAINELPIDKDIEDIGSKTIEEYKNIISKSKTILVGGTMGVVEKKSMQKGTIEILNAVADSGAFTLIGGGHAGESLEEFGIATDKFSYVSLAGGALITYLAGEKLPGVEALKQ